jgi:large subunit ribosomal protein L29
MAKHKKKELKDQSVKELTAHVHVLDREIFELRNELATQRKLEKPHLIKEKRKTKARILTILTQKQHRPEAV